MSHHVPRAGAVLLSLLLFFLPSGPAAAEPDLYRALQEFLTAAGYWDDEAAEVLEPLAGVLVHGGGTPDAHPIAMMDDIPGLRPLPDGVLEFIHTNQEVIYLAVGRDRLLVGVNREAGLFGRYRFAKFDLIAGGAQAVAPRNLSAAEPFLFAHGRYLGTVLFVLVMGTALMAYLAVRLRRRRAGGLPPAVDAEAAALRRVADARIFLVTGSCWLGLLAALYGLMHFTGRLRVMEFLAGADQVSFRLTDAVGFQPEQLRLASFALVLGLALAVVVVLALWSGALISRPARPTRPARPAALERRP